MKKTDIGVVAFVYAVALFFLSMTLKLPKPAQAYPLFIIVLLLGLTTLYVAQMVIGAKKKGVESGMEDFKDFLPKQFFPVLAMIIVYLGADVFCGILYLYRIIYGSVPSVFEGEEMADPSVHRSDSGSGLLCIYPVPWRKAADGHSVRIKRRLRIC